MISAIFCFEDGAAQARSLAKALGVDCHLVLLHRFPDGESLVRVPRSGASTALLYRSLDNPNAKLVELLLAASALKDGGASRVVLIAPYLAYMRQDMAFHPGEAVSQQVIGRLLAAQFDGLATVDPHLHRVSRIEQVVPDIPAIAVSAAPALSAAIDDRDRPVLVGPDAESRQWVEAIAAPRQLDVLIGEKRRDGDRSVSLRIPGIETVSGRKAILVDDVIASGQTLVEAARLLFAAGASQVEALATHCLASPQDLARLEESGIRPVRSTDCVAGPTARIPISDVLARAIREEGWSS